jgi:hypothetical protein
VQGRHWLQTSDALGAAAVQAGPEAVALGVLMNKSMGLPHADAAAILKHGFQWTMSPGGFAGRLSRWRAKPKPPGMRYGKRRGGSVLAHMDETSWKVEAQLCWLWAVVTEQVSFCEILPGRGFAQAKKILGAEYAGWLIHDGLRLYYKFLKAAHPSYQFHLIHRCQKMAEASPRTSGFPLAVETTPGASPGPTGPLWGEEDLAARAVDGHGSAGSEVGPLAGPPPTRPSPSAFRQTPATNVLTCLPSCYPVTPQAQAQGDCHARHSWHGDVDALRLAAVSLV